MVQYIYIDSPMCLHRINLHRFCGMDPDLTHLFRAWLFLIKPWSIDVHSHKPVIHGMFFSHQWLVPIQFQMSSSQSQWDDCSIDRIEPPRESPSSARRSVFVSTSSSYLVEFIPKAHGKLDGETAIFMCHTESEMRNFYATVKDWSDRAMRKHVLWSWLFYPILIIIILYIYIYYIILYILWWYM